ncbi:Holliday junction resolvase RecU [Paenibacillus sp. 203]|uniref:Holliday junction resolvase RecU n=1 Tax=Paenibacillus sp. 203 TaxID=3096765 RepID=UPI00300A1DC9
MIIYGNRGMGFENLIEFSNQRYEHLNVAVINKRPTPVKVTKSKGSKVLAGYFEKASTVDYDGSYRGRAIAFEAKSIKTLSSFPLKNLEEHQYEYLESSHRIGQAISFLLIEFTSFRETYLLPFQSLSFFWREYKGTGPKSISKDDLNIYGYLVPTGRVPVDYLKAVDKVWFVD